MITGITEEDEEEEEEEVDGFEDLEADEEVDQFGPELVLHTTHTGNLGNGVGDVATEPVTPVSVSTPLAESGGGVALPGLVETSTKTRLTAEALAKMEELEEEAEEKGKG